MTRTFRVGVVGGGFGQAVQVPAFRSVPGVSVDAICASTAERARTFADRLQISIKDGRSLQTHIREEVLRIHTFEERLNKPAIREGIRQRCIAQGLRSFVRRIGRSKVQGDAHRCRALRTNAGHGQAMSKQEMMTGING